MTHKRANQQKHPQNLSACTSARVGKALPSTIGSTLYFLGFLLILCPLLLEGCAKDNLHSSSYAHASHNTTQEGIDLEFTDDLLRSVTLRQSPKRVVALSASYAETWLLSGGTLVGTTSDAHDRKEFTLDAGVATIGTIKDPNSEVLLSLEPDFVLLSADIPSHLALSPLLTQCDIPHAYFHVEEMQDYLSMLERCTTLTGRKDLYRTNGLDVEQEIASALAQRTASGNEATYLLLRSYATRVKAKGRDNMVTKMLGDLALTNLTELHPSLLEELGMETIVWENPTYIFVIPMGDEEAAQATMDHLLESNKGLASLDAVQEGRYHLLPKELFHYKPNNRWGDSYAYLAKLLAR
ncbi:MAG TPA: ABC transporter substrate-binding protein [Sphaerochaeta sp.]|nr:ABC transporter substrate-binding protein [Sphaerochaeta sp.]